MTSQRKLIAATVAIAVMAGGGAALAAVELTSSAPSSDPVVAAPPGPGRDGYGLGAGMLGGRGFAGGVGPADLAEGDAGRPFEDRRFLQASLAAAAGYLGVPAGTVALDLQAGRTLAQVARSRRQPVHGLVAAIVAAEKRSLARAVTAGMLSQAQADAFAAGLHAQTTALVDGREPAGPPGEATT